MATSSTQEAPPLAVVALMYIKNFDVVAKITQLFIWEATGFTSFLSLMGTEESNTFGKPCKFMLPQDETLNRPLLPHWTTSMQAYYNSGSTPTPFLNPHAAGSYLYGYTWPNQPNSTLLQCDALHYPNNLSNKPHLVENAALGFSEMVHRTFGEQNQDLKKRGARNSQPGSLITKESSENGNVSSTPKNDRDGMSMSAVSGSKESLDEGHDDTNNGFPSTEKQQSNVMIADENSTELTQNLGTDLKASDSNAQLKKMDEDEIKKERKRHSNRESAKRSRIRRQKECEELCKNVDTLKDENFLLTQRLIRLSEECLELRTENDSIQENLVKMHGPESIADLLPMKPA